MLNVDSPGSHNRNFYLVYVVTPSTSAPAAMKLSLRAALAAALAVVAAPPVGVAAASPTEKVADALDPFPSLRKVGDTLYTTVNGWASKLDGDGEQSSSATVAIKGARLAGSRMCARAQ